MAQSLMQMVPLPKLAQSLSAAQVFEHSLRVLSQTSWPASTWRPPLMMHVVPVPHSVVSPHASPMLFLPQALERTKNNTAATAPSLVMAKV